VLLVWGVSSQWQDRSERRGCGGEKVVGRRQLSRETMLGGKKSKSGLQSEGEREREMEMEMEKRKGCEERYDNILREQVGASK
jgi:hypothetical protein